MTAHELNLRNAAEELIRSEGVDPEFLSIHEFAGALDLDADELLATIKSADVSVTWDD